MTQIWYGARHFLFCSGRHPFQSASTGRQRALSPMASPGEPLSAVPSASRHLRWDAESFRTAIARLLRATTCLALPLRTISPWQVRRHDALPDRPGSDGDHTTRSCPGDGSPGHSPSPRRWPGLFLLLRTQPFRYQLHPAACRMPSWSSLKSLRENHRFAASSEGVGLPTAFHHRGRGRGRAPGAMERAASPVRASRFPPRC